MKLKLQRLWNLSEIIEIVLPLFSGSLPFFFSFIKWSIQMLRSKCLAVDDAQNNLIIIWYTNICYSLKGFEPGHPNARDVLDFSIENLFFYWKCGRFWVDVNNAQNSQPKCIFSFIFLKYFGALQFWCVWTAFQWTEERPLIFLFFVVESCVFWTFCFCFWSLPKKKERKIRISKKLSTF